MSQLSNAQQIGITDFLKYAPGELVIGVARVISQNLLQIDTADNAIQIILQHSTSIESIFNRKIITKDILFQYLHSRQVSIANASTKQYLIERIVKYLDETYNGSLSLNKVQTLQPARSELVTPSQQNIDNNTADNIDSFPIRQMAEEFSKWFFQVYNDDELSERDFWANAKVMVQMQQSADNDSNQIAESAEMIVDLLKSLKNHYKFHFNPNLSATGVHGQMDVHGLVCVMNCGTLHIDRCFVGVYECAFGLLRDPFAENNWKIKHLKIRLRSTTVDRGNEPPSLTDSESLRELF